MKKPSAALIKFKRQLHRIRNRVERQGLPMAKKAITEQYNYVLSRISTAEKDDFNRIVQAIPDEPIKNFLQIYYVRFAPIAMLQFEWMKERAKGAGILIERKADNVYLTLFERYMYQIIANESGNKITTITATTKERILAQIRDQLELGEAAGMGIEEIRKNIYQAVGDSLKGNGMARAKAIAQTEMIQASNRAQHFAAESTGLQYRKFWSSSHLPGTRISHQEAEQDSIARGGLLKTEVHSNGLLYVGDPNGPASEVINCRCTELYEIV